MSCCGQPLKDDEQQTAPLRPYSVQQQQPAPHPGARLPEKQQPFHARGFPSPPPAHQTYSPPPGSYAGSSASPPPQFDPYAPPLPRPSPAYAGPHANGVNLLHTYDPRAGVPGAAERAPPRPDEGKVSIAIDFGTTFSGVAYGSSRIAGGNVQQILNWPGSLETFRKVPTCLLYDERGQVLKWGLEAKHASAPPGSIKCEWFKLFLEPQALRDESTVDPRLPPLPPGKKPLHVIVDFLYCMWEYAKEQITREIGAVADLDFADVWLTVPAAWDARGCELMREAALTAGLVHSARARDDAWRDRLHIITEPEAAAVHCAHLTDLHKLTPSQTFMICDAGGGTVDLAVYKIIGQTAHLEIAEMCARSGANCGSLFLDLRFRALVQTLLAEHPAHLDAASLAYFMHSFAETDKLAYGGARDDDTMFNFTCFNVEDPDDASVGLVNGELQIPGNLLRREVFDPVVNQVLELVEEQLARIEQPIHALLLVGGFSQSEYLFARVEEQLKGRIANIARPADADTATARGAAQYGLARRALVSSVVAPRSYMMKVKLPAEPDDMMRRPAYITTNSAGVQICENRLQYLVAKGAILRKGQKIKTKFCKFSQSSHDRIFVATLYTSDVDRIMRYTDEGETTELCKWTVDIGSLPSFQENARTPKPSGFYTDFELGLELDSAEVRGILLYEGQEWGRVVFDFLT
ncbi:actin-like ATPase domain-containing protein [Artomyces pyxidatus]|uniref:Actin-like ATPase domain-containing protein n=1 Tax=Artomyces pyxidatus TaxID=48021 RepID=A0ACB8SW75_9AGAM|nr:actin-like ATPase domain-containing protein [Artomyces pyxidatus]